LFLKRIGFSFVLSINFLGQTGWGSTVIAERCSPDMAGLSQVSSQRSVSDAELFLSDAVYLEELVRKFSPLKNSDDIYLARLNRAIQDPDYLDLLKDSLGVYSFKLWVEKISLNGNSSLEFKKLADKLLDRAAENTNGYTKPIYKLVFEAAAQQFIEQQQKGPATGFKKALVKALAMLELDPHYIGLRTHRDPKTKVFISYITNRGTAYRLIWAFGIDHDIKVLAIITHDEYGQLSSIL
jgi:hypothetical protein